MSNAVPMHAARTRTVNLAMVLVTVCWAGNIIAGKQALTVFNSVALAQLRMLGSGVAFTILFLVGGRMRRLRCAPRKLLILAVAAALCMALNQLGFIGGMALSNVAHTGLIVALGPLTVLIIAVVLRMEALTAWKAVGMLVAFSGVGILTTDPAGQGSARHWIGDLILLGGTLAFAVYIVLMKKVVDQFDTITVNSLVFFVGAVMILPFCARQVAATPWRAVTFEAWWGLAFLVLLGTVGSYLVFAYVMTQMAASRAAAFNYLQPIIAIGLGIWLLSERLTTKVLIGGIFILAGVYLTERERGERELQTQPAGVPDAETRHKFDAEYPSRELSS